MRRAGGLAGVGLAAAVAVWPIASSSAGPPGALRAVLVGQLKFTDAQVQAVYAGRAVTGLVPAAVDREIAVAGAVRVAAPAARLVDVIRDVESLEKGTGFLATRKMSSPPGLADMASLRLPADDVAALRSCRPGRCDVKLGQGAFDLLRKIDWAAPDATEQVNRLARQTAVEYVESYRQGGNEALAIYRDSSRPTFIAREFADMVRRSSGLTATLPDVSAYLLQYPAARPAGVDDFFYWSLADFGLKPVFRINHVVIHPTGQPSGLQYAVTTKQLYASHYFHTALEVRALIDDAERPGQGHYLIVLNLARSDGLTGLFGGIVKSKARSGAKSGLEAALIGMKRLAEARY